MLAHLVDTIPELNPNLEPPLVLGTAELATRAYHGQSLEQLLALIGTPENPAARHFDQGLAHQLWFARETGLAHQQQALKHSSLYRIRETPTGRPTIKLLAFMAPGDLMVNTPLDFLTAHLDIRLDLLYLLPNQPLPAAIPDHDVAICAVSDSDRETLHRVAALQRTWPRPILNDPRKILPFARDWLVNTLRGIPNLHCAETIQTTRAQLTAGPPIQNLLPNSRYPILLRPLASHGGQGLAKIDTQADNAAFLNTTEGNDFYLTQFINYRSRDGWFRKYRVAFIDQKPFLCHMAISEHWMIHYLNAGMTESAAKRNEEAQAMASFETTFATRHAAAFEALNKVIGLDFFSIDCGETRDGALLIFEADVAAIIHLMDPPEMFPYKRAAMQKCFDAFGAMVTATA